MRRRQFLKTGATAGTFALLGTTGAQAREYRPGGPWAPNERAVNYSGYLDNDQLGERLQQLDKRSDRVELRQVGESAGREDPIWEVTVGDGDESIHIINQIHGDEPTGPEAIVRILQRLANGNSPQVEEILDNLTITMMPRTNPDGSNFVGEDGLGEDGEFRQRRINTTEWEEGDSRYVNANSYYYWADPPGYDLNREFNLLPDFRPFDEPEEWWAVEDETNRGYLDVPVDEVPLELKDPSVEENPYDALWSMGLNLNPETQAITESYMAADPDWAITHHHQGPTVHPETPKKGGGPEWQSIMSVMAPFGPHYIHDDYEYAGYVGRGNPYMSEGAQTRSLQLNQLVNERMQDFGYGLFNTITRFGYGPLWGSYLDGLAPRTDAAGMLYEVSHQSDDRGHKALGTMVKASVEGLMTTFESIADGSIDDVDPLDYFDMPLAESIDSPFSRQRGRRE